MGISPFDIKATLAIPVKVNGVDVAEVQNVEALDNNGASISCTFFNSEVDGFNIELKLLMGNKTEVVACGWEGVDCVYYSCDIGRFSSSSHVSTVIVKIRVASTIYGKCIQLRYFYLILTFQILIEMFLNKEAINFGTSIHVNMNGVR